MRVVLLNNLLNFWNHCILSFGGWRDFSYIYRGVLWALVGHVHQNTYCRPKLENCVGVKPFGSVSWNGHMTLPSLADWYWSCKAFTMELFQALYKKFGADGKGVVNPEICYAFSLHSHDLKMFWLILVSQKQLKRLSGRTSLRFVQNWRGAWMGGGWWHPDNLQNRCIKMIGDDSEEIGDP